MELSNRQKDVLLEWVNTDRNICINAVAGSGKSTLLLCLIKKSKENVIYTAFNSSIQKEMQERFDKLGLEHAKSKTLHSLGYYVLRKHRKVNINNGIKWELLKQWQKQCYKELRYMKWEEKQKLNFFMLNLHEYSRLFLTNKLEELEKHFYSLGKPFLDDDNISKLWIKFQNIRNRHYNRKEIDIDYTDMIYLPVYYDLRVVVNCSYLMIDECQDLNLLQHKLIDKILKYNDIKKWVAVGDQRQSIYGFSGSFSDSMGLFKKRDNVVELPLDICYRCPKLVINESNKVYDVMTGFKEDDGVVEVLYSEVDIKSNSLVICRNTQPLIDLYFRLVLQDRSCYLKGEDILASIKNFLSAYKGKNIYAAENLISNELKSLNRSSKDSDKMKYHYIKDMYKIFTTILKIFDIKNGEINFIIKKLESLFVEKDNAIALCTIHKSKGLESDYVYILNEKGTIPSPFAKTKDQKIQEENLRYVARTRAKKEMYYLELKI